MSKKILNILNTASYSGAENVVITTMKNIEDRVDCAYASLDGPIRNVLDENNLMFIPIKKMTIYEIRRICKLYKPDVIHAHDYTASIISALSGINIPIISHLHNNSPWIKTYHPFSFIYLLSSLRYEKVLMVSDSIMKEYVFSHRISDKAIIISNPTDIFDIIDKAKVAEPSKKNYDVIFLGRLATPKNPIRFIEIIKKVSIQIPNIKVGMIGDGYLKNECIDKIKELNLSENIKLLGFIDNPYGILASSKLLCITSKWEGFGLVAVEALTLGRPVVSTSVGGLPGIVNDKCGLLTNDSEKYVSEVIALLSNKSYWNMKSNSAIKKSRELHNIDTYTKKICNIYKEI